MTDNRYPIGTFKAKESYSIEEIANLINDIEALPTKIEEAIENMNDAQLDTPYREGGWTVRQVVHHLPDSHMNAYVRMKWTITEDQPRIKAYDEKAWATTPETKLAPSISIDFLKSLHTKWAALMRGLSEGDLSRAFIHPDTNKSVKMDRMIGLYAWHGNHHLAHITTLKEKMGWK